MSKLRLLVILLLSLNFSHLYGQTRKSTPTDQKTVVESAPTIPQQTSVKNSYEKYMDAIIMNELQAHDVISSMKDVIQKMSNVQYIGSKNPYKDEEPELQKLYSLDEIKKLLLTKLNETEIHKDSIVAVQNYINQFKTVEDLSSDTIYKSVLENIRSGSYYPERIAAYALVRLYFERIVGFNPPIHHTNFVFNLLNRFSLGASFKQNDFFKRTTNPKTQNYINEQYLSSLYDFWRTKADESSTESYRYYVKHMIHSFYYFDKIRKENPQFLQLCRWISKNFSTFKYYSGEFFGTMPSKPSINDEIGILIQFGWLNMLEVNGIKDVWDNNAGENIYGTSREDEIYRPIPITKYKTRLLKKIQKKDISFSVETQTQNMCINRAFTNLSMFYPAQVLFMNYMKEPTYKSNRKFVFIESQQEVKLKQLEENNTGRTTIEKVSPRAKFSNMDVLLYYIFQRNKNTHETFIKNALMEVTDSIKIYNLVSLKEKVKYNLVWVNDSTWINQICYHLNRISLMSYDSVFSNKALNPNNARIIQYMTTIEREGKESLDSVTQMFNVYLNNEVKKSVPSKSIDLLKKDLVSFVDGMYNSIVKKSMKEKIVLSGETIHSSSASSPGWAELAVNPDGKATLNLTIYINGEAMYKYLNGKIVKLSNGVYQFASSESAFNFRYNVDICGKKTLELAGVGQNATIKAILNVK